MTLIQDVRYALRQLLKTPGFTITAMLTWRWGSGRMRDLYAGECGAAEESAGGRSEELVRVGDNERLLRGRRSTRQRGLRDFSHRTWQYLKKNTPEFEELAAMQAGFEYRPVIARRSGSEEPARSVMGEFVSGNYFQTFGLKPEVDALPRCRRCCRRTDGGGDELRDVEARLCGRRLRGGQHVLDQYQGGDDCGHRAAGLFWRSAVEHAAEFLSADRDDAGAGECSVCA